MQVVKRNGTLESVDFNKILRRLKALRDMHPPLDLDYTKIAQTTIAGLKDKMLTSDLDVLAAETAYALTTTDPAYGELAARLTMSNLQKQTPSSFSEAMRLLQSNEHPKKGTLAPLLADDVYEVIQKHANLLDSRINHARDFTYDYFAIKTLMRSYLMSANIGGVKRIVERPSHMLMRVAIAIHKPDVAAALQSYELMSLKLFTHATPTLYNAGTRNAQMSSCFLQTIKDDSITGIFASLGDSAEISKRAGGIGMAVSKVRSTGSYIYGTNGVSNGLVPMLRMFNDASRYVDQGGGKRKGAFAVYIEPWHPDIFQVIDLRKPGGKEEMRARDLNIALWVPDEFMRRVVEDKLWSLIDPHDSRDEDGKDLSDLWGEAFETRYRELEAKGQYVRQVPARELLVAIINAQIESGEPYVLFKDTCNRKSNQQHLGTIKCSNLCTEIIEYSSPEETAVCNLASIAVNEFFTEGKGYDFQGLYNITYHVTGNLNKVIDTNYYPIPEAKRSNLRHRPIGIGIQGLADLFCLMHVSFVSPEAKAMNVAIFETIYYAALTASCDLAKVNGPHESYAGSPASNGILQYDMWNVTPSERWDWAKLKADIATHGLRNSLLVAPMPTASTSQILGNNECFEPYTSNVFTRGVLAGEFTVVNKHLVRALKARNLWNPQIKEKIIAHRGSVQRIPEIPADIKEVYKTVWEYPMKELMNMAVDRGAFIDQSQSLNAWIAEASVAKMTSLLTYAWGKGLKTGMYYLRSRPAADPIPVTVNPDLIVQTTCVEGTQECAACSA